MCSALWVWLTIWISRVQWGSGVHTQLEDTELFDGNPPMLQVADVAVIGS